MVTNSGDKEKVKKSLIDVDRAASSVDDDAFFDDVNMMTTDDIAVKASVDASAQSTQNTNAVEDANAPKAKKKKSAGKTIGIIVGIVVIIVIALVVVLKILSKSHYTLNLVDAGTIVEQQPVFADGTTKVDYNDTTTTESGSAEDSDATSETTDTGIVSLDDFDIVASTPENPAKLGQSQTVDTVVNTKTANEETLSDHNGQFVVTYKAFETDYDKIASYIDKYNETSANIITLPSKEAYSSNGITPVIVEVDVTYPNEFPTYNSEGEVFAIPSVKLETNGLHQAILEEKANTDELVNGLDKYVVVNDTVYDISSVTGLNDTNDKMEQAELNKSYTYYFLVSMPYGIKSTDYRFNVYISVGDMTTYIYLAGQDVQGTATTVQSTEAVDSTESTTESTEATTETSDIAGKTAEAAQSSDAVTLPMDGSKPVAP